MPSVIPMTADPARRIEVSLNRKRYFLTTKYNVAGNVWSMDLEDSAGVILYGITLLTGVNLLATQRDLTAEIGGLWLVDTTGSRSDPGAENLGSDVVLTHFAPEETPDPDKLLAGTI